MSGPQQTPAAPVADTASPAHERATRAAAMRSAETRHAFENLRDLPPDMLPADMDVRWVTETVLGQYQDSNMAVRLNRDGFVPLTTDDIPALKIKTMPGRESADNLIRNGGGQVLMGRPREIGEEQTEDQLRDAREAERDAIRGKVTEGLDPRLARPDPKERTVVRRNRTRPQFQE